MLAIMIMQIINKRFWMHDFEVYYRAAQAFASGSQVYGLAYGLGSGFYKYSPFALLLFLPLSFLPFGLAKVIFFFLISGATISAILLCTKLLNVSSTKPLLFSDGMLFILLGIISSQVFRELHLGNINMLLLLLLLTMLQLILYNKQITAGLLFSVVLFIKPHFIVLIPLLFLRKYYKCTWATIAGLLTGFLITAVVNGVHGTIALHKQWLNAMQMHNQSLILAPDTIYSWLYRIMFQFFDPEISTLSKALPLVIMVVIAASFRWFVIENIRSEKIAELTNLHRQSFAIEYFLLIAIVPNLVLTDSEHFLLSAPIVLLLIGIVKENRISLWFSGLTILALLFYAINIHDLVGVTLSLWLTQKGILGLGNLMLIMLVIFWHRKHGFTREKPEAIQLKPESPEKSD
jgi:hypothetical protein